MIHQARQSNLGDESQSFHTSAYLDRASMQASLHLANILEVQVVRNDLREHNLLQ